MRIADLTGRRVAVWGFGREGRAALAALQAIESGKQVAFMAPTEILAEQHYRKLAEWLMDLPLQMAWLAGSLPAVEAARRGRTRAPGAGAGEACASGHTGEDPRDRLEDRARG